MSPLLRYPLQKVSISLTERAWSQRHCKKKDLPYRLFKMASENELGIKYKSILSVIPLSSFVFDSNFQAHTQNENLIS